MVVVQDRRKETRQENFVVVQMENNSGYKQCKNTRDHEKMRSDSVLNIELQHFGRNCVWEVRKRNQR